MLPMRAIETYTIAKPAVNCVVVQTKRQFRVHRQQTCCIPVAACAAPIGARQQSEDVNRPESSPFFSSVFPRGYSVGPQPGFGDMVKFASDLLARISAWLPRLRSEEHTSELQSRGH